MRRGSPRLAKSRCKSASNGLVEAERTPSDRQEGTFTLLGKESLMDQVGAGSGACSP
jgi:hypothetical protein